MPLHIGRLETPITYQLTLDQMLIEIITSVTSNINMPNIKVLIDNS